MRVLAFPLPCSPPDNEDKLTYSTSWHAETESFLMFSGGGCRGLRVKG